MANAKTVQARVALASNGPSPVIMQIRFEVLGGKFHGFDFAGIPGGELIKEESRAALDDGRLFNLLFRTLPDGRIRVKLAGKGEIEKGGVNFALVFRVDFGALGMVHRHGDRARLEWVLPVWQNGLELMKAEISFAQPSPDGPIAVSGEEAEDYEIAVYPASVEVTKFRPVKLYAMKLVVDFDARLVGFLGDQQRAIEPAPARKIWPRESSISQIASNIAALPFLALCVGLFALLWKALHLHRLYERFGLGARFVFLASTGVNMRLLLTFLALNLGLFAEYAGSLAAGIPALVAAAALWITAREPGSLDLRPGGKWRKMDEALIVRYAALAKDYRRLTRTVFDITTPLGIAAFLALLAALGFAVYSSYELSPKSGFAAVVNALILGIPAWFSSVRDELPMDLTLEGFSRLLKYRRTLKRACRRRSLSAGELWIREDDDGPIEVRLRFDAPAEGLTGIEVGNEVVQTGSLHHVRPAVVLRMTPGAEAARRLLRCPGAAAYHLIPDQSEEIIVLRSRRRRTGELTPLRSALAALPS